MAVTAEQFVTARPEFAKTPTPLVAQALADAANRVDAGLWGALTDAAVSLLAAHLLWASPFGTTARLDGDRDAKEKSRYWVEFNALQPLVTPVVL